MPAVVPLFIFWRVTTDVLLSPLSALHDTQWRSMVGHDAIIRVLVQANADVHASQHESGRTPLMGAAYKGKKRAVACLLQLKVCVCVCACVCGRTCVASQLTLRWQHSTPDQCNEDRRCRAFTGSTTLSGNYATCLLLPRRLLLSLDGCCCVGGVRP